MNFRKTYLWVAVALLVLLEAAILFRATRQPSPEIFADPFVPSAAFSVHLSGQQGGWVPTEQGLVMPPGKQGVRLHQFPKREGQRVFLSLQFRKPQGGTNKLHIHKSEPRGNGPSQDMILENQDFAFERYEITRHIKGEGFFQIYLLASAQSTPAKTRAEALTPAVTKFAVEYRSPRKDLHWAALIFFSLLAISGYAVFLLVLLPWGMRGGKYLYDSARQLPPPWRLIMLLLFFAAGGLLLLHPEHRMNKSDRFDDLAAVGTAALLHDNGYDVSEMFFRSRIRPALTAWILPWTELLPHRLSSSTFTPSDRKERMFFFYDRTGWSYGKRIFPEMSAFFAVVLLLGLLALVAMVREREVSGIESAFTFLFAAFFTYRCMYNAISSSANLATTIAAALLAWRAWREPTWLRLLAAGFVFSITVILKETFAVLGAALLLHQLWMWKSGAGFPACADGSKGSYAQAGKPAPLPRIAQFALFWGAAAILPLIYYALILDTGFAELPANHSLLYYHQKLHPEYEPLTLWSGLRTYWQGFGIGLPLAAIGLGVLIKRIRKIDDPQRFFLCWFVGTLSIVTMPYIFTRFLLFYIPPMAFLAVQGGKAIRESVHQHQAEPKHQDERNQ